MPLKWLDIRISACRLLFFNHFVADLIDCPAVAAQTHLKGDTSMPRKKKTDGAVATAELTNETQTASAPAYIDGPPVDESGRVIKGSFKEPEPQLMGDQAEGEVARPEGRNWGDPYKSIISTPTFEMGENRRFKQRVFMFKEKPEPEVLAQLKEAGFTYRANEKAWTIPANPDTRRLSEDLAHEFSGQGAGMER